MKMKKSIDMLVKMSMALKVSLRRMMMFNVKIMNMLITLKVSLRRMMRL